MSPPHIESAWGSEKKNARKFFIQAEMMFLYESYIYIYIYIYLFMTSYDGVLREVS